MPSAPDDPTLPGDDLTVLTYGTMVYVAEAAARVKLSCMRWATPDELLQLGLPAPIQKLLKRLP